jgi:hypothetical protein
MATDGMKRLLLRGAYGVSCTSCSFEQELRPLGGVYELRSRTMFIEEELVWCRDCRRVAHGERVPSLDELRLEDVAGASVERERIAQLAPRMENAEPIIRNRRRDLRRRIKWRERRSAPAKCLECGGTDFFRIGAPRVLGSDGHAFPHPGCDGELLLSQDGDLRLFDVPSFTSEGDRLFSRR